MKQFIVAFFVFLVWSFFGLWLFSSLKKSDNSDSFASKEEFEPALETSSKKINLDSTNLDSATFPVDRELDLPKNDGFKAMTDQGDLVFLFDEGIKIKKNTADLIIPPSSVDFKYKLNTYLIEHSDEELHILAYYDPSENMETPNFGEQRGLKILLQLLDVGILRERMVVKPTIRKMEFDSEGNYPNGIGFVFRPLDEERLNSPDLEIPSPRAIYPKFVDSNIYANEELKNLVTEMKQILTANPTVMVEVIGHTDDVGHAQDNYLLGLKYAQQVRWYLINKGKMDKSRIKALSKGELEPIADNNFKKGRIENRRIEIKYIVN